ncbi:hypothetical protein [Marinifilum flexuosum]|uniref:hypothetical protein n=1 Tax=Marinifilum flexuosum TaxID=1117708 RepID=UPI00249165EB|nr:hypothetical protein [Marinifilum flexuosum]
MKRLILLLMLTVSFAGVTMAQQVQDVTLGSTHTYTANPEAGTTANEYKWQIVSGGVDVIDLTAEKGAAVSITFAAADFAEGNTYQLRSQVIDNTGCISEYVYVDITVLGVGNVMFADLNTNDNAITCSLLDGDTPSATSFDVVFSGGVAPFELTYEVEDHEGNTTTQKQTFPASTGTISVNDWENTVKVDQTVTITLISAVTKDGQNVPVITTDATSIVGKNNIRTLTVRPKPVITNLTLN